MGLPARWFPSGLPTQFKLLVGGSLLTSTGFAMAFPFLTLYLNTRLAVPMDRVGLFFAANALAGLVGQTIAGPLADRFGRKPVMVSGLLTHSLVALGYTRAGSLEEFALLGMLGGCFGSVFMPASHAMVVDLVGETRRAEAFGLMRIASNLGFVIGPSLGGLLAVQSYSVLFLATASAQMIYMVALLLFARETLPVQGRTQTFPGWSGGYSAVLRDGTFLVFLGASLLSVLVYSQLGTTMPVYLRKEVGILESGYGLLMALNGGMVVLLQLPTTRLVERRDRVQVLALGTLCYAVGVGTIGWWRDLPMLALSIVVVTVGEMMIAPVASALVADLAPTHMRARYMAAFGLTWTLGYGAGPSVGGAVLEHLGGPWVWTISFVLGCASALAYLPLRWIKRSGG